MIFIKDIEWGDVYKEWKRSETKDEIWRNFFIREGFKDWAQFRRAGIKETKSKKLEWKLYKINPEEVLGFNCGAFEEWLTIADELKSRLFKDISLHQVFSNHPKIQIIKRNFPFPTQLIGFKKQGQIYIFDGHHRCVAISQLLTDQRIENINIFIALAEITDNKNYPLIDI